MRTHVVNLTENQRKVLSRLSRGTSYQSLHAQILLRVDSSATEPNWTDEAISQAFGVSESAIKRIRQCFVEEGMKAALNKEDWHKRLGHKYKTLKKVYERPPLELCWNEEFEPLYSEIKKELKEEPELLQIIGLTEIPIKFDSGEKRLIQQMGKLHVGVVTRVREALETAGIIYLEIPQPRWRQILRW